MYWMVYKKYIKRGGKIYGPYKYHSRKINGKVITEYRGKAVKKKKINTLFLILGFILVFSLIFVLNYDKIDFDNGIKITKSTFNNIITPITKSLTGFIVSNEIAENIIVVTDGYGLEGHEAYPIRGSRKYERCLKVDSSIEFNSVKIRAKVEYVASGGDLYYEIYSHDYVNDEPETALGNCNVPDPIEIKEWESCEINLNQNSGTYWVCAYSFTGDISTDYYKIYWNNQDVKKKRAFWTGSYWQKMDEASYTMKAEFRGKK